MMDKKAVCIVLIFVILSCKSGLQNNTVNNPNKSGVLQKTDSIKRPEPNLKDSSVFLVTKAKANMPLDFDDNDSLHFENGVSLKATIKGDETYLLTVRKEGKTIFSIDSISGVSKVLLDSDKLFFAVFTYVDEDGNNQGYNYIIDLSNNSVLKYPEKLKNTCNPISYKNGYCFIADDDQLQLIHTNSDMQIINVIDIAYNVPNNDTEYLDRYSIRGLVKPFKDSNSFQIIYTPNKFSGKDRAYSGSLTDSTGVIVLEKDKSKRR